MVPPALFVWLVLLVAAAKMPLEEAALVAGTSQNVKVVSCKFEIALDFETV